MKKSFLFVLLLFFCACVNSLSGPSDKEIKEIISKTLIGQHLPWGWGRINCPVISIDQIQVIERGKFNKENNYFPVKAKVSGVINIGFSNNKETFETIQSLHFKKDDYDKWQLVFNY
jgi:hypothetical protein